MTAPTRPPFTPTATLLGALRGSLFEARYRLPTSATTTTYEHSARALVSSQGRRPRPSSFSYASRTTSPCSRLPATLKSGDARRAAHASDRSDLGASFLSLSRVCPTAIPNRPCHVSGVTCTGLWTERRTCPRHGDALVSVSSACAWRTLTTFPSCGFQRTPAVAGAPVHRGRDLLRASTDRPRTTFLRHPAKAAGIPRIWVPSTVAPRNPRKNCSFPVPRRPPRSRRPHITPSLGTSALEGHCKRRCGDEPRSDFERAGSLFNPLDSQFAIRAWD